MKQDKKLYWIAQIGGWTFYVLAMSFFYLTLRTSEQPRFFVALIWEALLGFLFTQHLHKAILKRKILDRTLYKQIKFLIVGTLLYSIVLAIAVTISNIVIGVDKPRGDLLFSIAANWFTDFMLILVWNLIYLGYHYVSKSNKEALDKIRLENIVKDLQLKTIKSHINPHFIFNALNSIKALVDEDPDRTRKAITELSNILRSSLNVEKQETTSLRKELAIVKDYLALEKIRFEDRLSIHISIEEDIMDLLVPPMMLQTLVENGIKHGIATLVDGGFISIYGSIQNNKAILTIENSGSLNNLREDSGFGLASTTNRLQLIYGQDAHFHIKNTDQHTVMATLELPVLVPTEQLTSI